MTFSSYYFPKKRSFLGRAVLLLGGLAALGWAGLNAVGNDWEYSKSYRIGMINKFGEKGVIFKTYEGQMAQEGIVSGESYSGANIWDFSLDRQARHGENTDSLAAKITEYSDSGTKVKVTYIQPLMTWPWRSETNYLVQSVEPIEKK